MNVAAKSRKARPSELSLPRFGLCTANQVDLILRRDLYSLVVIWYVFPTLLLIAHPIRTARLNPNFLDPCNIPSKKLMIRGELSTEMWLACVLCWFSSSGIHVPYGNEEHLLPSRRHLGFCRADVVEPLVCYTKPTLSANSSKAIYFER